MPPLTYIDLHSMRTRHFRVLQICPLRRALEKKVMRPPKACRAERERREAGHGWSAAREHRSRVFYVVSFVETDNRRTVRIFEKNFSLSKRKRPRGNHVHGWSAARMDAPHRACESLLPLGKAIEVKERGALPHGEQSAAHAP